LQYSNEIQDIISPQEKTLAILHQNPLQNTPNVVLQHTIDSLTFEKILNP